MIASKAATLIKKADSCTPVGCHGSPLGGRPLEDQWIIVHDGAATAAETDWPQILVLYDFLHRVAPGQIVTLGRTVALSMVDGPQAGLRSFDTPHARPGRAT